MTAEAGRGVPDAQRHHAKEPEVAMPPGAKPPGHSPPPRPSLSLHAPGHGQTPKKLSPVHKPPYQTPYTAQNPQHAHA